MKESYPGDMLAEFFVFYFIGCGDSRWRFFTHDGGKDVECVSLTMAKKTYFRYRRNSNYGFATLRKTLLITPF